MRVIVHDFSGHPFQAELSRQLATNGNEVEHVFSGQYESGKGHLAVGPDDAAGLSFRGITLDMPFEKYSPISRLKFERAYAKAWIKQLKESPVDCIVACNIPLTTLFRFARFAKKRGQTWVFWHQDIYSFALSDELRRKVPRPFSSLGAKFLVWMEKYCARNANHVVAIGPAFEEIYDDWGVPSDRVSVIPNWAPLAEVFPVPRDNPQAANIFTTERLRLLYAGTIGRKHNPQLLVELLHSAAAASIDVELTIVSQGEAADDLAKMAADDPSLAMRVLPFQDAEILPQVLGSADVLVALLEPDATRFSIPSKVLTYMAAGRPILGLMPSDNPAALDITATGGFVAEPTKAGAHASTAWLAELANGTTSIREIGERTRSVAEQKFDVESVAHEFGSIMSGSNEAVSQR